MNNDIILQGISKDALIDEVTSKIMSRIEGIVKKASTPASPLLDKRSGRLPEYKSSQIRRPDKERENKILEDR